MSLLRTSRRLIALPADALSTLGWQRSAGLATKSPADHLGSALGNSMSDGFYDVSSPTAPEPPTLDRPLSRDPRVRLARAQQPPLFAPEPPGALHNSLSHGDYSSAARPRRAPPRSSVADPDHYLGDSMSEGFYEMPATLRAAAFRPRPRQGFRSSGPRSLPRVHRVVAASSVRDPEPLHNSLGHGDYAPPPPPRR